MGTHNLWWEEQGRHWEQARRRRATSHRHLMNQMARVGNTLRGVRRELATLQHKIRTHHRWHVAALKDVIAELKSL